MVDFSSGVSVETVTGTTALVLKREEVKREKTREKRRIRRREQRIREIGEREDVFAGIRSRRIRAAQRAAFGGAGVDQAGTPILVQLQELQDFFLERQARLEQRNAEIAELRLRRREIRKDLRRLDRNFAIGLGALTIGSIGSQTSSAARSLSITGSSSVGKAPTFPEGTVPTTSRGSTGGAVTGAVAGAAAGAGG